MSDSMERDNLAMPPEIPAVEVSAEDAYAAAREDLNFLAALCLPDVFRYMYPAVFLAAWTWLTGFMHAERTFPKLVLGLPRGFGKTAVIKLFVLYCIFFTRKQYVVVYCATLPMAENILADICVVLDMDIVKSVFGDWGAARDRNAANVKKFYFKGRPVVLQAAGVGTSIRGANLYNMRPDVQIFDDVQSRDAAESEVETKALRTWFYDTAMKTKSPFGCVFIFLGNMYPTPFSMLRELSRNPQWLKFITGAIRANGESLWEELYPLAQLLDDYEADVIAGREASFLAEMMNDEAITANSSVDVSLLPMNRFHGEVLHQGDALIIDPSSGRVGKDACAIGYIQIYDAVPVLVELKQGAFSPGDTIREAFEICFRTGCRSIFVEAVAYQETLLWWFNEIAAKLGVSGISINPIYPGRSSKNTRIAEMLRAWATGEVLTANGEVRDLAVSQVSAWNPSKSNNTDEILDILHYALRIRALHGEFLATQAVLGRQEISAIPVLSEHHNSSF